MSDLLVDGPDYNHFVFELRAEGISHPIRCEVIKTRKGLDQARAMLPAVSYGYHWELESFSGPLAEALHEPGPRHKFSSRIKPYR